MPVARNGEQEIPLVTAPDIDVSTLLAEHLGQSEVSPHQKQLRFDRYLRVTVLSINVLKNGRRLGVSRDRENPQSAAA